HGGLAGCPIRLVFHDFKALTAAGFSGESQTECSHFAEDEHVFAVITGTGGALENKTLITCLAQHGVVTLWGSGMYAPSAADFAKYRGYLYEPSDITPDRWGVFIDQLARVGYLTKATKLGVL